MRHDGVRALELDGVAERELDLRTDVAHRRATEGVRVQRAEALAAILAFEVRAPIPSREGRAARCAMLVAGWRYLQCAIDVMRSLSKNIGVVSYQICLRWYR